MEIFDQYSPELKQAWKTFDNWLKDALEKAGGDLIDRCTMPEEVKAAMNLILETPIPGYGTGVTGKDSCYMVLAKMYLTDDEPT